MIKLISLMMMMSLMCPAAMAVKVKMIKDGQQEESVKIYNSFKEVKFKYKKIAELNLEEEEDSSSLTPHKKDLIKSAKKLEADGVVIVETLVEPYTVIVQAGVITVPVVGYIITIKAVAIKRVE